MHLFTCPGARTSLLHLGGPPPGPREAQGGGKNQEARPAEAAVCLNYSKLPILGSNPSRRPRALWGIHGRADQAFQSETNVFRTMYIPQFPWVFLLNLCSSKGGGGRKQRQQQVADSEYGREGGAQGCFYPGHLEWGFQALWS